MKGPPRSRQGPGMDGDDAPISEADAIAQAAEYAGLPETQRGFVRRYLHEAPREWMLCCDSNCDPCVMTIRCGVAGARKLLGLSPLED